ncbi:valine--tRNA ligase [Alicyclobacillus mengziensis]|uniref:Valine--tRNA ligase n=1 Tax=Alicyclobacillus mengziensis TaxID=2931921 RepID=A0A9X7VVJ1_9BACL|nr:valine--tRNA ligase [Alicyclobacillus mengziensis]QSO45924.1 valine--tRNA ligase [Alicyclobacillus mengziensis]
MSEGEKSGNTLSTVYDPKSVEQRIYQFWEESGAFRADASSFKPKFSIVMPPPNVTGSLHLGHAWNNTLQDIIIRHRRMAGYEALFLPGTDHAGIATQTRVEKTLREETGQSRHDLGREAFVEKVWAWKHEYGNRITNQVRAIGSSCDWSRERFTMDEGLSRAVRTVFVELYNRGLIYRGNRIINWCPRCSTALSDIEVEHMDVAGKLYHIRYPYVDGSGDVVIATTRPETMFADVAVAVHPDDERYQAKVGKMLQLPLTDRQIPVIADTYVEQEFGTGCVKITPAHDPNDFEVGMRHDLPMPQCINADGVLTDLAGKYEGLSREEARVSVVRDLRAGGYLVKEEELMHAVGHCSRCDTVVEPFLSDQWFVKMTPLAENALAALKRRELEFVPDRFEKVFVHWLENVRDWCISRQLWWGHRIPAWYCNNCGGINVAMDEPESCTHCGAHDIHQDEDVLDTWFSSGLWPFSTMGWPDETGDYQKFYPTSALVTAYDILFFWVARMVFTGLEFTNQMPFEKVVVHGLIRDGEGRKMSKSLGNGVDPLDVIEKYGADALRFTLATGTSPGNDQRFYWEKVEGSRNFINKLWNASRFVLMNLVPGEDLVVLSPESSSVLDKWIVTRLQQTIEEVSSHLNRYDFGEAGRALYDFAWDEFCDWYIEFAKLSLYGSDEAAKSQTRSVLVYVLDTLLRLLHPMIPFVTEEIWQSLPERGTALIRADWPTTHQEWTFSAAVDEVRQVIEVIRSVRNIRSEMNVAPSKPVHLTLRPNSSEAEQLLTSVEPYIKRFCNAETVEVGQDKTAPDKAVTAVFAAGEIYVPLTDLVDLAAERDRLSKERDRLKSEVERATKKLANEQFVSKAPADVVESERQKAAEYRQRLASVEERIKALTAD